MCLDVPPPQRATSVIHTLPPLIMFASVADVKQGSDALTVLYAQQNVLPQVTNVTFLSE